MIVAFAGRRIDEEGATPARFPLANAAGVREELGKLFLALGAEAIVASAACGADLLALDAADKIGLRRRVVLPVAPERFREKSVVGCPGDWGRLFDQIITQCAGRGDLVVLAIDGRGKRKYAMANEFILDEAMRIAGMDSTDDPSNRVIVVIAWDGMVKANGDLTFDLAKRARSRGVEVAEIFTVQQPVPAAVPQ